MVPLPVVVLRLQVGQGGACLRAIKILPSFEVDFESLIQLWLAVMCNWE